jgi:hypothetical protein
MEDKKLTAPGFNILVNLGIETLPEFLVNGHQEQFRIGSSRPTPTNGWICQGESDQLYNDQHIWRVRTIVRRVRGQR